MVFAIYCYQVTVSGMGRRELKLKNIIWLVHFYERDLLKRQKIRCTSNYRNCIMFIDKFSSKISQKKHHKKNV